MALPFLLTWVLTHFTLPHFLFGLANHDPVWGVAVYSWGSLSASINGPWTSFPPPHIHVPSNVHGHITLPKVFTAFQWMLWWTSITEVITSHLSVPGKLYW